MLNSQSPTLRTATHADALCLGVLASQVFLDTYATSGIRAAIASEVLTSFSTTAMHALLDRDDGFVEIAEHAGHLIGFVQLGFGVQNHLIASPVPAELERLYVQERFTGHGVGAALLCHAERIAGARGVSDVWLSAWVHNQRALRFYTRQSYLDIGAMDIWIEGERHLNRVLWKRLAP